MRWQICQHRNETLLCCETGGEVYKFICVMHLVDSLGLSLGEHGNQVDDVCLLPGQEILCAGTTGWMASIISDTGGEQ